MIFRQYLHSEPVIAASYLFGCAGKAQGAVVDPVEDIDLYLRDAERLGLPIRYVIDTPEHISLLGRDHTRSDEPWFVLTGHTLMVGDMGRTELASSTEEGAEALFESAERLRGLPDHIEVFPGAFSGSVCGRGLSGKPSSTIGFERRFNRAFSEADRGAFTELMLREIPPRPPGAEDIRARNMGLTSGAASAR